MELKRRKILNKLFVSALLVLVVLSSGCSFISGFDASQIPLIGSLFPNSGESGKGMVIESTELTESRLAPDQSTTLKIKVENWYPEAVKDVNVDLYNTGNLGVNEQIECNFDLEGYPENDLRDYRTCRWKITAPDSFSDQDFQSQKIPMGAQLTYNYHLSLSEKAPKISFKDDPDPTWASSGITNQDLSINFSYRTDLPYDRTEIPLRISLLNSGSGKVSELNLNYKSSELDFEDCPSEIKGFSGSTGIKCNMKLKRQVQQDTRFSFWVEASYKYVESKEIPIVVVNDRAT